MTPSDALTLAINPALDLLPPNMTSDRARVMLLAMGLQESHLEFRRQKPTGPARGLWQNEQGTPTTRGGVWGLFLFPTTKGALSALCQARRVGYDPVSIYNALENDDIFAAGCARLLLYTDPKSLPDVSDVQGSWDLYLRVWRPGKPRPAEWGMNHYKAAEAV
ncbi:hypothetical protein [Pandoraea sputorum]|uniref:Uncharacterized protein n=1 Tax=Pandoraea sputorum TaxID=93222 RepID=A0A5E5BDU5_9BURK|nr:hypothetical protein [Pandoraea sputorum]VVE82813.1 hypothetical protein PSP31121_03980 [Pandoraea sputorum]